jgi:hypothetical protein
VCACERALCTCGAHGRAALTATYSDCFTSLYCICLCVCVCVSMTAQAEVQELHKGVLRGLQVPVAAPPAPAVVMDKGGIKVCQTYCFSSCISVK